MGADVDLKSKACIVTGSTKGIGRATAAALAEGGADVVVSARSGNDVDRVVREIDGLGGGRTIGVVCDVRDPEACQRLVDRTTEELGRLDVLVNNAGWGLFAPIQEMSLKDWRGQIDTNLGGVFYCSKAAIPHLSATGDGWIINIGSLASRNSFAGGVGYNASKFGLLGMSEAMMLDLRYEDIRVSLIMPGSVATDFGGQDGGGEDWKLHSDDVAQAVIDLLAFPGRALPSRIEMRPSQPRKAR